MMVTFIQSFITSLSQEYMKMAAPATPVKPVEVVKPARKARKPVDPNETKSDKFRRLANHRVPRILKLLKAIGSLGNKSQYESTPEQRKAIMDAIASHTRMASDRLNGGSHNDNGFKL